MSYAQNVMEGLKQKYASEPVFLQRRMEISLAPGRLRVIAPGS